MSIGDFGWGGTVASPPNGRGTFNPTGWYYSTAPVDFGGGSFFIDYQYSSTRGGLRISTNPYTDNFYMQGWDSTNNTWRQAAQLWHTQNFNPNDYQLKGNYQPALGYTPVNKAGDTMTGNLVMSSGSLNVQNGSIAAKYDITCASSFVAGATGSWATGIVTNQDGVWFGNAYNKYRFYRDGSEFGLALYTGEGHWVRSLFLTSSSGSVINFNSPITVGGVPTGNTGIGDIGTYALLGTQGATMSPGHTAPGSSLTWANSSRAANAGTV